MVKLYAVCCAPLMDETRLSAVLPRLDGVRTARIIRQKIPLKRAESATAGLLLNHLFGHEGQPPHIVHGSRGKPYLADNSAYFNLSHSGGWVVCAVSDSEVGVDAQEQVTYNEKVAARSFTKAEREWLTVDADARFTRLWACKEAYAKLTGFGLVLPTSSYTVPTPPDGWDDSNHCCWKEYTLPADKTIHIAVCCGKKTDFTPLTVLPLEKIL